MISLNGEKFKDKNIDNINKELLKSYCNKLISYDLDLVTRIDMMLHGPLVSDIQKSVLQLYLKHNTLTYKQKLKIFKDIYKKYGNEILLHDFIFIPYSMVEIIGMENGGIIKDEYEMNKAEEHIECASILANFMYICLIIHEELLTHNIAFIMDSNKGVQLVRNKTTQTLHVLETPYTLPCIASNKGLEYIRSLKDSIDIVNCLGNLFVKGLGELTLKLVMKKEYTNDCAFTTDMSTITNDIESLRYRKVLTPHNGIVLKINEENSLVESMFFKEKAYGCMRFIVGTVRYRNGKENNLCMPLHNPHFTSFTCEEGVEVIMHILKFYGTREVDYTHEVLSPYYWKYRENKYETSSERNQRVAGVRVKREHLVDIAPTVRKINGKPSKEAIELAGKLCINLDEGYTLVREHTRTYNKTI